MNSTELPASIRSTVPPSSKPKPKHVFQYLYILLLYMPDYKNEPAGVEALLPWSDFIKETMFQGDGHENGNTREQASAANLTKEVGIWWQVS